MERGGDSDELLGTIQNTDTRPLITAREEEVKSAQWIPTRYSIAFVTILGYSVVYLQRCSFNIALVAMVNFTQTQSYTNTTNQDVCPNIDSSNNRSSPRVPKEGEFHWDSGTQDLLLGSFYYGYIVFQLLGGFLADRYSGKIVLGTCIAIPSVMTLLMPVLARWDVRVLIAARVLTGLIQGPMYPCMVSILGRWIPVMERARAMSFMSVGYKIACLISPPVTGFLCDSSFLGGWPSPFYLFGAMGCLWFVLWMATMHDSPAKHPTISIREKNFIQESINETGSGSISEKVPWRGIVLSVPVWAMAFSGLCDGVGYYIYSNDFPIYVRQVLQYNIEENGLLNAALQVVDIISSIVAGVLSDFLQQRGTFSVTILRKLFTALGHGAAGLCNLGVALFPCDQRVGLTLMVIGMGMGGTTQAGFSVNPLDLAPQYSGTIMGILNTVMNVGGFLSPAIVQAITNNSSSVGEWQVVFYVTSAIFCSSVLVYTLLGSSKKLQLSSPVASTQHDHEEENQ